MPELPPDFRIPEGTLLPVVVQDATTGAVLMLAHMNQEALDRTRETEKMHYWSRSRNRLWRKGEESGNEQALVELLGDCDGDALLARVEQKGIACHEGRYSCFAEAPAGDVLLELDRIVAERGRASPPGSYTARLLSDENLRLKKVVEEAGEVLLAAKGEGKDALTREAADLLYHLVAVLRSRGVDWVEVQRELRGRRQ